MYVALQKKWTRRISCFPREISLAIHKAFNAKEEQ